MNDLSDPSLVGATASPAQNIHQKQPVTAVTSGNKEAVGGSVDKAELVGDGASVEFELPKEVQSAGVRIQPTTVSIPPVIAKMGVQTVGQNVTPSASVAVALPLSDDQIAQGLHESVTSSVRWLAEWCVRKLKRLHIALKEAHGKYVRVKVS